MSRRAFLIAATAVAVLSDAMLGPFYPRLFAGLGVTDERHVGAYVAATCLAVIVVFPGWARLAAKVPTLTILLVTQLVAGLLGGACFFAPTLAAFWIASIAMVAFKGSYLLIYPYLLSLEPKSRHERTIGLLTVIVHLGSIGGALLGGTVLELWSPRHAFLFMSFGDFVQMAGCLAVFRGAGHEERPEPSAALVTVAENGPTRSPSQVLGRLAAVHFAFYFCVFLPRPFFAGQWAAESNVDNAILSGIVFAIPALVSLVALSLDARSKGSSARASNVLGAIALGIVGFAMQSLPSPAAIVLGRCISGWALFRAMVRLDLLVFDVSQPAAYASDFARINVFQQLGAMVAAYGAGAISSALGNRFAFGVAALGLGVTALVHAKLFPTVPSHDPEGVAAS